MWAMLEQRLMAKLRADPALRAKVKSIETNVADASLTPSVAAEQIAALLS